MYGLDDHHLAQCSQPIQAYQDHHFLLQQHGGTHIYGGRGSSALMHHEVPPSLPWSLPQLHSINPFDAHFNSDPVHHRDDHHDPFLVPPHSCVSNRRGPAVQFAYDGSSPFSLQAELEKITAQELMDAKALAASKSHSEAERRRRERIKNHLDKLRSLLPSTTKTDKASLLAEVIQHVKELQRQTSLIDETSPIPAEIDELTVDASDEDGKFIIKASLCCEDRSDLLPDLIKTLKALRLRTLKAEITTLGGRVKNVLFITGEEDLPSNIGDDDQHQQYSISRIQEALKAVMEKSGGGESTSGSVKRQRTKYITVVEQQHQQE